MGDLRLQLPVPNDAYSGTFNASAFGPACPQQAIQLPALPSGVPDEIVAVINELFTAATPVSEDCAYSFDSKFLVEADAAVFRPDSERGNSRRHRPWCKAPGGCGECNTSPMSSESRT